MPVAALLALLACGFCIAVHRDRNGTPIGRLIPIRRRTFVPRAEVMAAFATSPVLDESRFRDDLDAAMNQDPFDREW